MNKKWIDITLAILVWTLPQAIHAQTTKKEIELGDQRFLSSGPLTLQQAIHLAIQNSKDLHYASTKVVIAERSADAIKAEFMPNLFAGSGAGYSYGIPETPGGRAPSVFNVTYNEQILNEPLRGQGKEYKEEVHSEKIRWNEVRDSVIVTVTNAYLELSEVRQGLVLLRGESQSASRILEVTEERVKEGYELPLEVTKAKLTVAQIALRIARVQGRESDLRTFLSHQIGRSDLEDFELASDSLPGTVESDVLRATRTGPGETLTVQLAESDMRAKESRLLGEKRGKLPTLSVVGVYSLLSKYNNYSLYFNHFQQNNVNVGIQVSVPIFSAKTNSAESLADANLQASKAALITQRDRTSADIRKADYRIREEDAAMEVHRLELQLSQEQLNNLQARFDEGKVGLREVEEARVNETENWLKYLDGRFRTQESRVDLLKLVGHLDSLL
jgi:outer membrane protein